MARWVLASLVPVVLVGAAAFAWKSQRRSAAAVGTALAVLLVAGIVRQDVAQLERAAAAKGADRFVWGFAVG